MKTISDRLYALLEIGCKQTGTYEPNRCLGPVEEQMTLEEIKVLTEFLQWCHDNGKTFGHGNYNERFTEWREQRLDVEEIAADAHDAADKLHKENKPIARKQHNCHIFSRGFEFLSLDENGERDEELVDYCDRDEMTGEVVQGMIAYARKSGSAFLAIGYGIDAAESKEDYDYGNYEPMFDWVDLDNIDIR